MAATFVLVDEIRALRNDHAHNVSPGASAGVALHRLYKELRQRTSSDALLALLTSERENGTLLIFGKRLLPRRGRQPIVIECELEATALAARQWKRLADGTEECYSNVRVYVVADGLPKNIARQGRVKHALARQNSIG